VSRFDKGADTSWRSRALHLLPSLGGDSDAPVSVASAVLWFVVTGLVAIVLIGVGVIYAARNTATDEAVADSIRTAEIVSRGLVEPVLDDGVVSGDPDALERLDASVQERIISDAIVRVKLWTRDGVIVYSDEPRIIGQQYPLDADDIEAFEADEAAAEISDLSKPENVYEREFDKLLEVYFPVRTPDGTALLFEAYLPYSSVSSNASVIWRRFLPVFLFGLVVLAFVQIPLAWSLAYRLRRRQDEREALLRRAVEASDRERRIIAAELHDGAVQNLIGQSFRLTAVTDGLVGTADDDAIRGLREASDQSRKTVQELRTLLVDLYPPNLSTEGLESAFSDLVVPLTAGGIDVNVSVNLDPRLPPSVERLIYRAAREALRNVLQHSGASHVGVTIERHSRIASLCVSDDGRGIVDADRERQRSSGHLGLDLIEGFVTDAGGVCRVLPGDGGGTRFVVEVPIR